MPRPTKAEIKLALLKQLQANCTPAGIDECVQKANLLKNAEQKDISLSAARDILDAHLQARDQELQDLHRAELKGVQTSRITATGSRCHAVHLSFGEMIALTGLEFRTQALLAPFGKADSKDDVTQLVDDPTVQAVKEYYTTLDAKSDDAQTFRADLQNCSNEIFQTLFTDYTPLLTDDQDAVAPAFQRKLAACIAKAEKELEKEEQASEASLKHLKNNRVFLHLVKRASNIAQAPIWPEDLAPLKKQYKFTDQRKDVHRDYYICGSDTLESTLQKLPRTVQRETHVLIPILEKGPYPITPRNHYIMLHMVLQPDGTKTATLYDPKGGSSWLYNLENTKKTIKEHTGADPKVIYMGDQRVFNTTLSGYCVIDYGCAIIEHGKVPASWYQKNRLVMWLGVAVFLFFVELVLFTLLPSFTLFGLDSSSFIDVVEFSAFFTTLIVAAIRLVEIPFDYFYRDKSTIDAVNAARSAQSLPASAAAAESKMSEESKMSDPFFAERKEEKEEKGDQPDGENIQNAEDEKLAPALPALPALPNVLIIPTRQRRWNFFISLIEKPSIAGFCLMLGFGLFSASSSFGLAVPDTFLMAGVLGNPLIGIFFVAIGFAFLCFYVIRKINFSTPETPIHETLAFVDQTLQILEQLQSLTPREKKGEEKIPAPSSLEDSATTSLLVAYSSENERKQTPTYTGAMSHEKELFSRALLTPIQNAIKALDTRYESPDKEYVPPYLIAYGTDENTARLIKEDLRVLYAAEKTLHDYHDLDKDIIQQHHKRHDLDKDTIQQLYEIFERFKNAEIDFTHNSPFSADSSKDQQIKMGLIALSISTLILCAYTLFSIFTTASWIVDLGMTGSMLIAAGAGFLSWLGIRPVLKHSSTGHYGLSAALCAPFLVATIFILYTGSLSALGPWFAAFLIPALLFFPMIIAAICYGNDDKTDKRKVRENALHQVSEKVSLALKLALIVGLMILASLSLAMIFNIEIFGMGNVLNFVFTIINATNGNVEANMQWAGASFIAIFTVCTFAITLLIQNVLQVSAKNSKQIAEIKNSRSLKFIAQIIKLGFTLGMLAAFYGLSELGSAFAGASTNLFLPFLLVGTVMVMLSGKIHLVSPHPRLDSLFQKISDTCNEYAGTAHFHGKDEWKYAVREPVIFSALILPPVALIMLSDSFTPINIILSVGALFAVAFRTYELRLNFSNPTVMVQDLLEQRALVEKEREKKEEKFFAHLNKEVNSNDNFTSMPDQIFGDGESSAYQMEEDETEEKHSPNPSSASSMPSSFPMRGDSKSSARETKVELKSNEEKIAQLLADIDALTPEELYEFQEKLKEFRALKQGIDQSLSQDSKGSEQEQNKEKYRRYFEALKELLPPKIRIILLSTIEIIHAALPQHLAGADEINLELSRLIPDSIASQINYMLLAKLEFLYTKFESIGCPTWGISRDRTSPSFQISRLQRLHDAVQIKLVKNNYPDLEKEPTREDEKLKARQRELKQEQHRIITHASSELEAAVIKAAESREIKSPRSFYERITETLSPKEEKKEVGSLPPFSPNGDLSTLYLPPPFSSDHALEKYKQRYKYALKLLRECRKQETGIVNVEAISKILEEKIAPSKLSSADPSLVWPLLVVIDDMERALSAKKARVLHVNNLIKDLERRPIQDAKILGQLSRGKLSKISMFSFNAPNKIEELIQEIEGTQKEARVQYLINYNKALGLLKRCKFKYKTQLNIEGYKNTFDFFVQNLKELSPSHIPLPTRAHARLEALMQNMHTLLAEGLESLRRIYAADESKNAGYIELSDILSDEKEHKEDKSVAAFSPDNDDLCTLYLPPPSSEPALERYALRYTYAAGLFEKCKEQKISFIKVDAIFEFLQMVAPLKLSPFPSDSIEPLLVFIDDMERALAGNKDKKNHAKNLIQELRERPIRDARKQADGFSRELKTINAGSSSNLSIDDLIRRIEIAQKDAKKDYLIKYNKVLGFFMLCKYELQDKENSKEYKAVFSYLSENLKKISPSKIPLPADADARLDKLIENMNMLKTENGLEAVYQKLQAPSSHAHSKNRARMKLAPVNKSDEKSRENANGKNAGDAKNDASPTGSERQSM